MAELRVSAIAEMTGFSMRYWQRRIAAGGIPGARYVDHGGRKSYIVDEDKFVPWWQTQVKAIPCRETSESGAASGGRASRSPASRTSARSKQTAAELLKNDLRRSAES